jgi:hypothetical protein
MLTNFSMYNCGLTTGKLKHARAHNQERQARIVRTMTTSHSHYQSTKFAIETRGIKILEGFSDEGLAHVTFAAAWGDFVTAIQKATGSSKRAMTANKAWKLFESAISASHDDEENFSNALFTALRKSLKGFCQEPAANNPGPTAAARKTSREHTETDEPAQAVPMHGDNLKPASREQQKRDGPTRMARTETKRKREQSSDPLNSAKQDEPDKSVPIRLKKSNVGFATGVYRHQRLGFPLGYSMSTDSIVDHECLIFRDEDRAKKKKKATGASASLRQQEPFFDDVTACVELKHSGSSCSEYKLSASPGPKPEWFGLRLSSSHGPIAQALMYTMDVWHCLARRGLAIQSLPVVVLAGRKSPTPDKEKLCCMKGSLHIPDGIGHRFSFQVDRCLEFSRRNDEVAIAIYLTTLTTGLNHAQAINQRNRGPVTLCCTKPITGLQLLSSPIPDAQQETDMVIGQGELYRATGPSASISRWISWFSDNVCFAAAGRKMEGCLVKISHKTVHNSFVPVQNCWLALKDLASTDGVHKVLLACALQHGMCLVTAMEDLSPTFHPVSLSTFPDRNLLWTAFLDLAENVLLPLADRDIVHTDIRCVRGNQSSYHIFNILGRLENGSIELRLIDYESLCKFQSHDSDLNGLQADAVSVDHFHFATWSAHVFLCYQVLWMAYVLHENPDQTSHAVHAGTVVRDLLSGTSRELRDFRRFLGPRVPALKERMGNLNALTNKLPDNEPPCNDDEPPADEPAPLDTRRAEVLEILWNLADLFS